MVLWHLGYPVEVCNIHGQMLNYFLLLFKKWAMKIQSRCTVLSLQLQAIWRWNLGRGYCFLLKHLVSVMATQRISTDWWHVITMWRQPWINSPVFITKLVCLMVLQRILASWMTHQLSLLNDPPILEVKVRGIIDQLGTWEPKKLCSRKLAGVSDLSFAVCMRNLYCHLAGVSNLSFPVIVLKKCSLCAINIIVCFYRKKVR